MNIIINAHKRQIEMINIGDHRQPLINKKIIIWSLQ